VKLQLVERPVLTLALARMGCLQTSCQALFILASIELTSPSASWFFLLDLWSDLLESDSLIGEKCATAGVLKTELFVS